MVKMTQGGLAGEHHEDELQYRPRSRWGNISVVDWRGEERETASPRCSTSNPTRNLMNRLGPSCDVGVVRPAGLSSVNSPRLRRLVGPGLALKYKLSGKH